MRKRNKYIVHGVLFVFLFVSCNLKESKVRGRKVIKIAIKGEIKALNPHFAMDYLSYSILYPFHYKLFTYETDGSVVKDIVEKYRISDRKVYFKIKRNLRFSNKKELTAEVAKKNLLYFSSKTSNFPYRVNYSFIKDVKVYGKYEFEILLSKRKSDVLEYLTIPLIDDEYLGRRNIASSLKEGCRLIKRGNKVSVKVGKKIFLFYPVFDDNVAMLKLLKGEVDVAIGFNIKSKKGNNIKVKSIKTGRVYFVFFNMKGERTISKECRRFILCNLRKQYSGFFGPSEYTFYRSVFLREDIEKGMEYDCKILKCNLKKITVMFNSESDYKKRIFLFIKSVMSRYGIEAKERVYEYGAYLKKLYGKEYEIAVGGYFLSKNPDIEEIFAENSKMNYSGYNREEIETLFKMAKRTSVENAILLYRKINNFLFSDMPFFTLPSPKFKVYYRNDIKAYFPEFLGPDSSVFLFIERWQ